MKYSTAHIPTDQLPAAAGIYSIRLKGKTKVLYTGASRNIRARCEHHDQALRKGRHQANELQLSYWKHGPKRFVFEVIELCGVGELFAREQHWLRILKPRCNVSGMAGVIQLRGRPRLKCDRQERRTRSLLAAQLA